MSATLDHLLEPLSRWLDDDDVEEVCLQEPRVVWVYSRGEFTRHHVELDASEIEDIAIVAAAQRRQDVGHDRPLLSTDLIGRGRLQAVLAPCVQEGRPSLTIRRGSTAWPTLRGLTEAGLFANVSKVARPDSNEELLSLYHAQRWDEFLALAVRSKKTIIGCGQNASGKTHLSKGCVGEIPLDERLITIEDSPELRGVPHPNYVALYYDKNAGNDGVKASDLVDAALRMRIGRLFLQEIRDGEAAIAFLIALQTGHAGGITTIHASHCAAVFDRLRVLIKQTPGGAAVSDADLMSQLHQLVDIVVHSSRDRGSFSVDEIWFREAAL